MNPLKTPQQMLMEEAHIPHYAAGNIVQGLGRDLMQQFSGRIQEAIRKYVRATGKMPSREEVAQLEQHIQSLTKPTPATGPAPTQARLMAETPAANKLVDASGRPYSPIPDPKTGALQYPEQAGGYHAKDKFGMGPANMAARKKVYDPAHVNVFGEDPFLSMANTGRVPSRTWMKSYTPSVEELSQRELQAAETGAEDTIGGLSRVRATEGDVPTIQPSQIAETASALEAPAMDKISTEILMGKHKDLVRQVEQDFKERGIVPDQEDIINAVTAMINPMRHNYTGINPIGQRPTPPRGRPSATAESEMRQWRDTARASGLPETVVSEHPHEWPMKHKQDYLLDTEPGKRGPFAKDWELGEYAGGGLSKAITPAIEAATAAAGEKIPQALKYVSSWYLKESDPTRFKNPVTLTDGARLSGFTSPEHNVFFGYTPSGQTFTIRKELLDPTTITTSRDKNKTAEYLKESFLNPQTPEGFASGGLIPSSNPNDSNFSDGGYAGQAANQPPITGAAPQMNPTTNPPPYAPPQSWSSPSTNPLTPANMFHSGDQPPIASTLEKSFSGVSPSPRDMQAQMLVQGYADGKIVKKQPVDYGVGRAAAQGLTMGWSDEAEAAAKAAMGQGTYEENLAAIQAGKEKFESRYPGLNIGAQVVGSIPTMFIPGMGQMNAAKMAAMGAIYGAGEAKPGERLEGAAIGAPMGVIAGKGIEYMGKGANAAYQAARRRIMNPEAKVAEGVTGRPFDFRSGMKAPTSPERQQWIGQAHEAGVRAFKENDPAYKAAVFASWLKNRPEIIQQTGAQNYDQLMKAAYGQVAKETGQQFKALPNKVRMYGPDEAAQMDYLARASRLGKRPAEFMRERLAEGKPFNIFKDVDNPHPYLAERDPQTGMNQNEQFRAVHDYFGHLGTKKPNTFGPQGEENAWLAHRQMYSPLAEPAMTSETRGANSWVNYVDPENIARRKRGLHTVNYAENQPVLLPAEASDPAYAGGMPEYLQRIIK